jgi:hypothetical protein
MMRERVLMFPNDVAVGHLHAYRGATVLFHTPARGTVRVPFDAFVHLSASTPLRGLGNLAPEAVQSVSTPKKGTTDLDLSRLAHLTGLRELWCSKANAVTDAGAAHLAGLRRLRVLNLYWSAVGDAGLAHVAGMVQLADLHLGLTGIKGPGLAYLSGLQRLARLSLEDTDVDDSVVPHLLALRGLRRLAIWGTRLSTKGLAALRAGLPDAQIAMKDPGRRLAAERSREATLRILARRLLPDLPPEASAADALAKLLPRGTKLVEWRLTSRDAAEKLNIPLDDLGFAARCLAGLPFGSDLRLVTPTGLDLWIRWLRPRRGDRRRAAMRSSTPSPATPAFH